MSATSLDRLFRPRSVAVIGASSTPTKIGGLPIAFLRAHGFEGDIYPINPKADRIQDLPAYPSIAETPGQVDLICYGTPILLIQIAVREKFGLIMGHWLLFP